MAEDSARSGDPALTPYVLVVLFVAVVAGALGFVVGREWDRRAARVQTRDEAIRARRDALLALVGPDRAASTLSTIHSQLALYALQHGDQLPDLVAQQWKPLTHQTTWGGGRYGPYLASAPVNPFNGSTRVVPPNRVTASAGWVYEIETSSKDGSPGYSFRIVLPAADVDPQEYGLGPDQYVRPPQ